MISFFLNSAKNIIAVQSLSVIDTADISKLKWLFGEANQVESSSIEGYFVGPRKEMITPWSTNAVEITQNMGIIGIIRIEEFFAGDKDSTYDPMLQQIYNGLGQELFTINKTPDPIIEIEDIAAYNE